MRNCLLVKADFSLCMKEYLSNNNSVSQPHSHFPKLTIGYPLGKEIIEPEAEVVDSESIRSGNVLVQSKLASRISRKATVAKTVFVE